MASVLPSRLWLLPLAVGWVACAAGPTPVERAVELSTAGQDREAIAVLEAHLGAHPRDVAERRMLARLHAARGDLGASERAIRELAAVVGPESPIPWLERGYGLELAHHYEEALAMYDRAAEVAPKDPSGPRVGGLRAARWGLSELALPRLETSLRRDSTDATVWHALGVVRLQLGDARGAREAYASGLRADPEAIENRLGLATVALELHEPAAALREYGRILELRPDYKDALLGRSWAFIELGRFEAARAALAEAQARGADAKALRAQLRALEERAQGPRPHLSGDNH